MQPLGQLLLAMQLVILVDPHYLAEPKLNLAKQAAPQKLVAELPAQGYPKTWATQMAIAVHLADYLSPIAPISLEYLTRFQLLIPQGTREAFLDQCRCLLKDYLGSHRFFQLLQLAELRHFLA